MRTVPAEHYLRILLRQQRTGFYLQPSGDWNEGRDTAWNFSDAVKALCFAEDKQLQGADILMAVPDQSLDIILARI